MSRALVTAILLAGASWVGAGTTISVDNRAAFEAPFISLVREDFETQPIQNLPFIVPVTLGNIVVTANGTSNWVTDFRIIQISYGGTLTDKLLEMTVDRYDGFIPSFTINLGAPVTAFGADFGVVNRFMWPNVQLVVNDTTFSSIVDTTYNTHFIGITSDTPFSTALLTTPPAGAYVMDMNNVVFGSVPEPAALGLLAIAGVALGFRRRRI